MKLVHVEDCKFFKGEPYQSQNRAGLLLLLTFIRLTHFFF